MVSLLHIICKVYLVSNVESTPGPLILHGSRDSTNLPSWGPDLIPRATQQVGFVAEIQNRKLQRIFQTFPDPSGSNFVFRG